MKPLLALYLAVTGVGLGIVGSTGSGGQRSASETLVVLGEGPSDVGGFLRLSVEGWLSLDSGGGVPAEMSILSCPRRQMGDGIPLNIPFSMRPCVGRGVGSTMLTEWRASEQSRSRSRIQELLRGFLGEEGAAYEYFDEGKQAETEWGGLSDTLPQPLWSSSRADKKGNGVHGLLRTHHVLPTVPSRSGSLAVSKAAENWLDYALGGESKCWRPAGTALFVDASTCVRSGSGLDHEGTLQGCRVRGEHTVFIEYVRGCSRSQESAVSRAADMGVKVVRLVEKDVGTWMSSEGRLSFQAPKRVMSGHVMVSARVEGEGFHRELRTDIHLKGEEKSNVLVEGTCTLLVVYVLPHTVFVDTFHLEELKRFGGDDMHVLSYVDLEAPSSSPRSRQFVVVTRLMLKQGVEMLSTRLPIHGRYQEPSQTNIPYSQVHIPPPIVLADCDHGHSVDARVQGIDGSWFLVETQLKGEASDELVWAVPVGLLHDATFANGITLGATAVGTILVMWAALLQHKKGPSQK